MENLNIGTVLLAICAIIVLYVIFANFAKMKKFVLEVATELKKVTWSTRKDLLDATWIVMLSSFFLGFFISGADFVLSKLLGIIIK